VRYTFNNTNTDSADVFDVPVLTKLHYNAVENYIAEVSAYYETGFLEYFFGTLANPEVLSFICGVMSDSCGFDVDTNGPCQARLGDLPIFTDGDKVDGNSIGCRSLHAVFAAENPKHCAHISFEPMEDPLCRIKCQESALIDVMDLYNTADISSFRQFAEDKGIDINIGYAMVP